MVKFPRKVGGLGGGVRAGDNLALVAFISVVIGAIVGGAISYFWSREPTGGRDGDMASNTNSNDGHLCCICYENEKNIALQPCGHMQTCELCSTQLPNAKCPICQVDITGKIKVYS
eukprot:GHVR01126786.1.p1 GENE.GHVR01126786.1~~GHVR01126786.1.p1  ORF type:complete len:116 (+),score=10.80 GHVR01126786.1:28-375(+)